MVEKNHRRDKEEAGRLVGLVELITEGRRYLGLAFW